MTKHEEYEKIFITESMNLMLDRKFQALRKKVKEVLEPTDLELFQRLENLKRKEKGE
jgi:hypothetical protein